MAILQLHANGMCNILNFAPEESSDLLLAANHCKQSRFFHQQIVWGGACNLAQVPALRIWFWNVFVPNCVFDIEKGRLLFSSLLEAERGIALVHLGQGKVLGADRGKSKVLGAWSSRKVSRLQNPLDPHKLSLGIESPKSAWSLQISFGAVAFQVSRHKRTF